jgi:Domain of unknown function (DUF2431)
MHVNGIKIHLKTSIVTFINMALIRFITWILLIAATKVWSLKPIVSMKRWRTPFMAMGRSALTLIDSSTSALSDVKSWLVCGDGDLSFSTSLAHRLEMFPNVSLTATVLESQASHEAIYTNSRRHVEEISRHPFSCVRFEIDATKLDLHFQQQKFDRILFNFPHWRGKSNHRRNRELLDAFLQSAGRILSVRGEIHIALTHEQGGFNAQSQKEWKESWMPAMYAAQHGLLLHAVDDFTLTYTLSSHRGVDRPFPIGKQPKLYRFRFPNRFPVDRTLQLCCRHELHFTLPEVNQSKTDWNVETILYNDTIQKFIIDNIVLKGIEIEVPRKELRDLPEGISVIVVLIVYRGACLPLTRSMINNYRARLEEQISTKVNLRETRMGRLVSKPFPSTVLPCILLAS